MHRISTIFIGVAGMMLTAAAPDPGIEATVRAALAKAPPGTRFGLVVSDAAGVERVAIDPDGRYVPASNTKIFTTLAAFATLPVDGPDDAGTGVRIEGNDVVLVGAGDARLSSAADCRVDCLSTLADAVAARTRVVGDVIGDDSRFPDQRWSPGMGWNNMAGRYGTATSALTLDDNEVALTVTAEGGRAVVSGSDYYRIDNRVRVGAASDVGFDRMPGSDLLRLSGTVKPGGATTVRVGVEDAAHFAAWTLAKVLRTKGVRVTGTVGVRHRPYRAAEDGGVVEGGTPPPMLAQLRPGPLVEDVATTNKTSQNLHAELLLRRIGRVRGTGSIADGLQQVAGVMQAAGVPRTAWSLSDGSGMSTYNRVSPRAMVTLLRWAQAQPWGARWVATLPVGGVDGTLARRFRDTPLAGRLHAKTGSLSGASALAGTMTAASGQTLTFAIYANDHPDGSPATPAMDAALLAVAAAL
ncbi:D-alanyl-D-alanine carboxypeptidase/D-alanyl-D-alanine-endopeptidase [Sphingomonas sp. 2R-10]|uniref:D-alanyl-D-alanine carboxypeptidase/D-alanyl-D-alanine endopeptidase n=1 Tax=Sphingomonas sp. 2R-10 TaxID=3045148 RepID=UPI0019D2A1AD|nr:D-alanyl-D-alanine carboxypeptidase/D-alanyl-D-alanine-endopeptidase [Sphingomonas sp. 2R-10]MDJ0278252.1 D-alanyl-D-alanine carboxypeptidase/D-alanyl-D-alanine-endopeptidase [Sphingomonas sp. 2R-10]